MIQLSKRQPQVPEKLNIKQDNAKAERIKRHGRTEIKKRRNVSFVTRKVILK